MASLTKILIDSPGDPAALFSLAMTPRLARKLEPSSCLKKCHPPTPAAILKYLQGVRFHQCKMRF